MVLNCTSVLEAVWDIDMWYIPHVHWLSVHLVDVIASGFEPEQTGGWRTLLLELIISWHQLHDFLYRVVTILLNCKVPDVGCTICFKVRSSYLIELPSVLCHDLGLFSASLPHTVTSDVFFYFYLYAAVAFNCKTWPTDCSYRCNITRLFLQYWIIVFY
jgi:hypothetical protein